MLKFKFNKIVTVTFNDVLYSIHIIIQENETCPATKPEKNYNNKNEREFPA
jgi:hypothetical protein